MPDSVFLRLLYWRVALVVLVVLWVGPAASGHGGFKVLVFSRTMEFRHASIDEGVATIQALGVVHDFQVTATEDASLFNAVNLAQYRVVVFLNTTGDVLDAAQQAAFEAWYRAGNGWVGVHAATDTERGWPWYGQLIGAWQSNHPSIQQATVRVTDRVHPSTQGLPERWVRTDEWYNFETNPKGNVHVLAWLDEATYAPGTGAMGVQHPIAWCKEFDGGRAWYTALGHTEGTYSEAHFLNHLRGGIEWAAGAVPGDAGATVWSKWEKVVLDGNALVEPIAVDVARDGRVFYIERGGKLYMFNQATSTRTLVNQFSVNAATSDGLIGMVLDPGFLTNNWIYLFYGPSGTETVRLSRFTMTGPGTMSLASERILLTTPIDSTIANHFSGDMEFGPDGTLYLSIGDNSRFNGTPNNGYAPIDERAGQSQGDAQRTAANSNDLRGKILRIQPEASGTYTIPAGNLFPSGTAGTRPEIFAMGLRNPYRIGVDPATGWVYWGEVGPDANGDSATQGSRGFDELNQARTAGFFGWPYGIANNKPYKDFNFATLVSSGDFNLASPVNTSPNNTGIASLPAARPAWFWYPYGTSTDFPEIPDGSGRCVIAGGVYQYDAALAQPKKLPAYYDRTLIMGDFSRQWLREVKIDASGAPLRINEFVPNMAFSSPIDIDVGPDGSIYVVEYGTGWRGANAGGKIVRLNYTGGNRSPSAIAAAVPLSGTAPLAVAFSSAGSGDPDGDAITFAWDFQSNGSVDSTLPNPNFSYAANGNYTARLTVTDARGNTAVANVSVTVGNTAPVVTIDAPVNGGFFDWGDSVPYAVRVTDAEDGSTTGGAIPASAVQNQTALGHEIHRHTVALFNGTSGTFAVLSTHEGTENLFYVFESAYTDHGAPGLAALTGGATVALQPKHREAEYWASASGVSASATGDATGVLDVIGIDHGDYLSIDPVNFLNIQSLTFRVAAPGTGGQIEVRLDSPTGPLVATASVPPTGGAYVDVTAALTDPGGTHAMFLVFTRNPGNTNLFKLNTIVANGAGIGIPPAGPPGAPVNLRITDAFTRNQVTLAWQDTATNESGFEIERRIGTAGVWIVAGNALAGQASLVARGVSGGQEHFFRVRAVNASGGSAWSNQASVTMPAWSNGDIGTVNGFTTTGVSYHAATGVDSMTAAGNDIWTETGTSPDRFDSFHFLRQTLPLTGNGEITARVLQITCPNGSPDAWFKAGVMLRSSLATDSVNAFMGVAYSVSNGATFQRRTTAAGTTTSTRVSGFTAPYWVRLVRSGSTITGWRSADGVTWTSHASQSFTGLPATLYVGTVATAHNKDNNPLVLNLSTFDNIRVVPAAVTLPTVTLLASQPIGREADGNGQPVNAAFTISRTGSTAAALKVNVVPGGSATAGADYAALPLAVTIPAGAASALVPVAVLRDALAEGSETVELALVADTSYTVGAAASGVAEIQDSPIDAWKVAVFPPEELLDPQVSGDFANTDFDLWNTLQEFAFAGDPRVAEAGAPFETSLEAVGNDRFLTLTYTRRKGSGLLFIGEVADALTGMEPLWDDASGATAVLETTDLGATERIKLRRTSPVPPDGGEGFLRLRVRRPGAP